MAALVKTTDKQKCKEELSLDFTGIDPLLTWLLLLPEPIEKTVTRNMFHDEQGKYVRTKKEILDLN